MGCNFPLCFVGKVLERPDAQEAEASQIINVCCAENGTFERKRRGEERRREERGGEERKRVAPLMLEG